MNNSINTPRLTSALQLIEQAAAVLVAVSLSAEEMDAADVVDAIKACSSLVIHFVTNAISSGIRIDKINRPMIHF